MFYRFRWIVVLLVGYWLAIFTATHIPLRGLSTETEGGIQLDKVAHFLAYFGLGCLLVLATCQRRQPRLRLYAMLIALLAAYGALDELSQAFVPSRFADIHDWFADVGGSASAILVHGLWTTRRTATNTTIDS